MKNKIIIGTIFLVTGLIVGNNLYNKVDLSLIQAFKETNEFYLLELETYSDKETMQKQTRDISPKIYELKDNKYHVYVGITGSKDNASKIENIYKNENINVYTTKIKIKDEEFINNINQFDILIENTNNQDEILTIEEVVLSSYNKKVLE